MNGSQWRDFRYFFFMTSRIFFYFLSFLLQTWQAYGRQLGEHLTAKFSGGTHFLQEIFNGEVRKSMKLDFLPSQQGGAKKNLFAGLGRVKPFQIWYTPREKNINTIYQFLAHLDHYCQFYGHLKMEKSMELDQQGRGVNICKILPLTPSLQCSAGFIQATSQHNMLLHRQATNCLFSPQLTEQKPLHAL